MDTWYDLNPLPLGQESQSLSTFQHGTSQWETCFQTANKWYVLHNFKIDKDRVKQRKLMSFSVLSTYNTTRLDLYSNHFKPIPLLTLSPLISLTDQYFIFDRMYFFPILVKFTNYVPLIKKDLPASLKLLKQYVTLQSLWDICSEVLF